MVAWSKNSLILIGTLVLLAGCDLIKMKETAPDEAASNPIARVGSKYLDAADIEGMTTESMTREDSAQRVQRFVNNWIRKQLLIKEAASKIEFDEAEIERKILDYRYSLMGYEYQSYYVDKNLNKIVAEDEILTYYEANKDNFILKQNIIRGKFVKLPVSAPRLNKVKKLLNSTKEEDLEELNSYCLSFATNYELNDSIWMVFDEVVKNSDLAEIPNKVQFLKRNEYTETEENGFKYFLKIEEYRISDNISPLEFVKEDIKNIIINKRKVELANNLEDDVYERARNNNEFEIFN